MRDYVNGAVWPNRKLDGYAPVTETGVVPGVGNAYTVELGQRIVRNGTLVIVSGGTTLTAVPYGSVVALGQAGVSYDLPLVQLNSARAGEALSVNYTPGGGVLSSSTFADVSVGTNGTNGVGVPAGGTAGQSLTKVDGVDYNTAWSTPAGGGGIDTTMAVTDAIEGNSYVLTFTNGLLVSKVLY